MSAEPALPPSRLPPARAASAMRRRFGILFHLLGLGFLLRSMRLEEHSAERIRRAANQGPVVYVLHTRSLLDWLALNVALNARRLPLAGGVNGVSVVPFLPLRELAGRIRDRFLRRSAAPAPAERLRLLLEGGEHAGVFLVDPPRPWAPRGGRPPGEDAAAVLLGTPSARPVQVVPVVVVWKRAPPTARTGVMRSILGEDAPGLSGRILGGLLRPSSTLVQAGEPLDLAQFAERTADEPPPRRARMLRVVLRRYLYREQSMVRGPRVRSRRWMRRLVLASGPVQELVEREARATGQPEERIRRKVGRTLDRIAARISFPLMRVVDPLTRLLWDRLYSGVDLRPGDLDRVRHAQRQGTAVLLPCHRSHLDYMLLSSILYQHDLALPHIAAGMNLSFWPLGAIFRRLGAFFVKRTFKGERIFPTVFSQYLRLLVREGYAVEFFIEGGRSRTGKLLPPRLGLLGMVADTAASLSREDFEVTLLPINITYERIAEEQAYARELAGERKRDESLVDMAKAGRVLRHRFGRVYLRFAEPISLREALAGLDRPWADLDRKRRDEILQHLGERVLHRINQEAVVTPTSLVAAALLTHPRRGIRRDVLLRRVERFRALLVAAGAEQSVTMGRLEWAVDRALRQFVAGRKLTVFEDEASPVYRVADEHRITLDFYKNTVAHYFVPSALLALAIQQDLRRGGADRPLDLEAVHRTFGSLAWLFRFEFVLDPEGSTASFMEEGWQRLAAYGATTGAPPEVRVADADRLAEVAAFMANFIESYLVVLRGAHLLRDRLDEGADLLQAVRKAGEGMYAVEEVRRPEALSTANLRNALRAFKEEGIWQLRPGGGLDFDERAFGENLEFLAEMADRA